MQELPDVPLFVSLHNLCATLKCTSPSAVMFRSAVINAGYRISGTHVNPLGLKSDAPMDVIWDIMRCWVRIPFYYLFDICIYPILQLLALSSWSLSFDFTYESSKPPIEMAELSCLHVILLQVLQTVPNFVDNLF